MRMPELSRPEIPGHEPGPDVLRVLVAEHARFLAFVERRVGSREVAEDILQEAFVRGIERASALRNSESAVAWFYTVLRNAIVDHYRRRSAEERAFERAAGLEDESEPPVDEEMMDTVCKCVTALLDTLKPEYADALRKVELEEMSVSGWAAEAGISANNASVRLHRAREALKRQLVLACGTCVTHGCLDCTCTQ